MMYGEERSKALFTDKNEKFIWQLIISLLVIQIPISITTTFEEKVIWIIIYSLIIIIIVIIFSIIKRIKYLNRRD